MIRRRRPRAGFTLIELLVVIAIIAVLIALLLPAVQAAREAARRSQCVNNLMQLGIALKNYEGAFEALPSGVVNPTGPIASTPTGYHFNWIAQVLPFLDERPVHRHLNFNVGVYDPANTTVRSVQINLLLCPSQGGPTRMVAAPGPTAPGDQPALTSYAANYSDAEVPIDATNNGVFFLNSRIRYEDLEDGSSQTLFLGEKLTQALELGWASGTSGTLRNTGWRILGSLSGVNAAQSFISNPTDLAGPDQPVSPAAPPANPVGGFSSHHPGGSNFAFGDGSVRFLKMTIRPVIFARLANRADGNIISEDGY